jgi:hypothetical protein
VSESGAETGKEPTEPTLEELFKEIMAASGLTPQTIRHTEDALAAGLTEATMGAWSRIMSQASPVERVFLVEILARALADALAPALAKALAPDVIAVLGHVTAPEHMKSTDSSSA